TSQAACHGEVAVEECLEATDALAAAGIHLVGHCRAADLTFGEAFGGELLASHEAESGGEAGSCADYLIQAGYDFQIQAARVDLSRVEKLFRQAEVLQD